MIYSYGHENKDVLNAAPLRRNIEGYNMVDNDLGGGRRIMGRDDDIDIGYDNDGQQPGPSGLNAFGGGMGGGGGGDGNDDDDDPHGNRRDGGGDDDHDDDDDDGDDDDDDDDDGDDNDLNNASDNSAAREGLRMDSMTFALEIESEDSTTQKWRGKLDPPAAAYADYNSLFLERVFNAFLKFYLHLLNLSRHGVQLWWEIAVRFERDADEGGSVQTVDLPMRLRTVRLLDNNELTLRDVLIGQMNDLLSRVSDLIHQGSDWTFVNLGNCVAHVSRNLNFQFNLIGSRKTLKRNERRYGPNAPKHLNSKNRPIMPKHLISLCSENDDCFILSIALALENITKEDLNRMKQNDQEFVKLKSRLRTLVHQTYDTTSVTSYPTSLHEIDEFRRANKDVLSLNVYGFRLDKTIKSRKKYVFFPVSISKENGPHVRIIDLVITYQSSLGTYHLNYASNFNLMLRNSVHPNSPKKHFCRYCCGGYRTENELSSHAQYCSVGDPRLEFPSKQRRLIFEAKKKSVPTTVLLTCDIETALSKENLTSFGPLSETSGRLEPVMIGYVMKFLLHADLFPQSMPKMLEGPSCVEEIWKFLQFDVFYINSLINQMDQPIRPLSDSEKQLLDTATNCACCKRFFSDGRSVTHHCHAGGEAISKLCYRCNARIAKLEVCQCLLQNLQSFDSVFLLHALNSAEAKKSVSSYKIFAKESQKILKMDIHFKCLVCDSSEMLSKEDLKKLAVFPHREEQMREVLLQEYDQKLAIVQREIQLQRENAEDGSILEIEEEVLSDQEEEGDYESFFAEDPVVNSPSRTSEARCKHFAAHTHRRLSIKDSLMLIRCSLQKALDEMVSTALQPSVCEAYPHGDPSYPQSKLWLSETEKTCLCCAEKYSVRTEARDVCHFSEKALGSVEYAPRFLSKLPQFPYKLLDLGIPKLKAMKSWPSRESFQNALKDNEEITEQDYSRLKTDCANMGVTTGYGLLYYYLSCDLYGLANLLHASTKYLFKNFELNLLRYMSISKFGYDLIIRTANEQINHQGLEYVSDENLYRMYKAGSQGGFLSCNAMARSLIPNMVYNPEFDVDDPQSIYMNLDITSHYGSVLMGPFSFADHQYHDATSDLVQGMNTALDSQSLSCFVENLRATKDVHIFMTVILAFSPETQLLLREFVPIITKQRIGLNDLSFSQRSYANLVGVPMINNEINVSAFGQQTVVLTYEYVHTLQQLGVTVIRVCEAATGLRFPIFRPILQKILTIKNTTKLAFRKSWMKARNYND